MRFVCRTPGMKRRVQMSRLWYRQSAGIWEEALPLGNGRLGAMVYGGADREHI